MAYLLLWSAIERFASLRWGFADGPTQRVMNLASEPAFAIALKKHATSGRVVYRADKPGAAAERLDPGDPPRAIRFYYQVRSNITHRGKAAYVELELVRESLSELHQIFHEVLHAAWGESSSGGGSETP
jgi:hypothetical protein